MERIAKRLADEMHEALPTIEPVVRDEARVCDAAAISIGLDRTCEPVVGVRCKRPGQRWRERGLSCCLTLRTLHLDGRLRACVDRFHSSYVRDVRLV